MAARISEDLQNVLTAVWQQALVENASLVEIEGQHFPVKRTSRHRLRQVDFRFGGEEFRGLEQNPDTSSRWAQLARKGQKVMQFLRAGRYLAVIADGKMTAYGDMRRTS